MSTPSRNTDGDPVAAAIHSLKAEQRAVADEDSAYKKQSLFWSRLTLGAVTIYTMFTGILLWMNKCSLDETRTEFEINQRPWVASNSTSAAGPILFDTNGAHLQLKYFIPNSGNTPATNVFLSAIFVIDEPDQSFVTAARTNTLRRGCTAARALRETSPQTIVSIFPKSHIEGDWGAYIKRDEIEKMKNLQHGMIKTLPHLIFCIDYEFTFTKKGPHLTAQLFSTTSDTPPPFSMNEADPPITVKLTLETTYAD